jgi:hypothetical protein
MVSPTASPSPTAAPITLYLRSWTENGSIGPVNSFGAVPIVISDGQLMTVRYTATGSPVPLYTAPERRSVSQAGLSTIMVEAGADGLLGTDTTFDCPPDENGGDIIGGPGPRFLVLTVNGVTRELRAGCSTVEPTPALGTPQPATWAAFQRFRSLLADPASWLGSEIGPAVTYDPDKLAVLAVALDSTAPSPGPADVVRWPLATAFASFGVAFNGYRCAVVSGPDATALLAAVRPANTSTAFRDARGALAQLVVRAFMPGEPDPCAGG